MTSINPELIDEVSKYVANPKTKSGLISIVLPLYGSYHHQRSDLAVKSFLTQQDIDLEIIISEQSDISLIKERINDPRIRYLLFSPEYLGDRRIIRQGALRNLGVQSSNGEFVCVTDSDILFKDTQFLINLIDKIKAENNLILYHPPMRRLLIECFEEFKRRVCTDGITSAINSLDLSENFIAKTDCKKRNPEIFRKLENEEEVTYIASREDFLRYLGEGFISGHVPAGRGHEPAFWTPNFHTGTTVMRRTNFEFIGGYDYNFLGWGCQDIDMQWKLSMLFNLQKIPYRREFEVLHLDHPREYFSCEGWKRNENYHLERKKKPFKDLLIEDLLRYNALRL